MGEIQKAIFLDSKGRNISPPSQQIKDSFAGMYGDADHSLRIPPFSLESLVVLAEAHPTHSASIEQKAVDIISDGLQLKLKEDMTPEDADDAETDQIDEVRKIALKWWEGLFEEITSQEAMLVIASDHQTTGWAMFEIGRDSAGIVRKLYHIPSHTMRASGDGKLFAQVRSGKKVWFKLWGDETDYLASDGTKVGKRLVGSDKLANEILIFRLPSSRSTWYGIPRYVSAIGHLALAVAARDFNIQFFDNYREPRHLVIISGLEGDVKDTVEKIDEVWRDQLENNPHHNVIVPIKGDAKVTIQKMGVAMNDLHFAKLMEVTDAEILVAHRMPPDRLGIVKRGALGGSTVDQVNEIYKDAVVSRGQRLFESRLQRFFETEFPKSQREFGAQKVQVDTSDAFPFLVDFQDLDISDKKEDADIALAKMKLNAITINEARIRMGDPPMDKFKNEEGVDLTLSEFLVVIGGAPLAAAAANMPMPDISGEDAREKAAAMLDNIDQYVKDLIDANEAEKNGYENTE